MNQNLCFTRSYELTTRLKSIIKTFLEYKVSFGSPKIHCFKPSIISLTWEVISQVNKTNTIRLMIGSHSHPIRIAEHSSYSPLRTPSTRTSSPYLLCLYPLSPYPLCPYFLSITPLHIPSACIRSLRTSSPYSYPYQYPFSLFPFSLPTISQHPFPYLLSLPPLATPSPCPIIIFPSPYAPLRTPSSYT